MDRKDKCLKILSSWPTFNWKVEIHKPYQDNHTKIEIDLHTAELSWSRQVVLASRFSGHGSKESTNFESMFEIKIGFPFPLCTNYRTSSWTQGQKAPQRDSQMAVIKPLYPGTRHANSASSYLTYRNNFCIR